MNLFVLLGGLIALATYFPLCAKIRSRKMTQSLPTWVLWTLLDGVIATSIIFQNGNFLLPITYMIGSGVTVLFIIKFSADQNRWTGFDTFVTLLVIICIVVWALSGPKLATIAGTLAMGIAGIPQLRSVYRKPWENSFFVYLSYSAANILSAAGGKDWSIEERFFPLGAAAFCLAITVLTARKFWSKSPQPDSL